MKNLVFIALILVFLSACAYPATEVKVTDHRASIAVRGAPEDAVLYVDGLSMGAAAQFDGKSKVLLIEPGVHKVEVVSHSNTLLSEKAFLGSGELKIFITAGIDKNQ